MVSHTQQLRESWLQDPELQETEGQQRCLAWIGAAGTGKTSAVFHLIHTVLDMNGSVLVMCPTGKQVSLYRSMFPACRVDTIHGATGFYLSPAPPASVLAGFDLWILEEIGQVNVELFETVIRLWLESGRLATVVCVGDFLQLPPLEATAHGTRTGDLCKVSSMWCQYVKRRILRQPLRCVDPQLQFWLDITRVRAITLRELRKLLHGRRFRNEGSTPSPDIFEEVIRKFPHTTIVTWSLDAAEYANDCIVSALFREASPAIMIKFAPASDERLPVEGPLFLHQRVTLTLNLDKAAGFVNGMGGTVCHAAGCGIIILTDLGSHVWVFPWTRTDGQSFHPLRSGYAVNISKIQGETLSHLSLWLDRSHVEAAAYTALSRARHLDDIIFLGCLTPQHFQPSPHV